MKPNQWIVSSLPNNIKGYSGILFINKQNGCLINGYKVLKSLRDSSVYTYTNDGGETWDYYPIENLTHYGFRNIAQTPNKILFTSGFNTDIEQPIKVLFKSKNQGLSWQKVEGNYPNMDGNSFLHFTDDNTGITSTVLGIQQTLDGGQSWHIVFPDQPYYRYFDQVFFVNSTTGFVAGGIYEDDSALGSPVFNQGSIIKTSDGGKTWEKLKSDFKRISSIFFLNENIGFVSTTEKPALFGTIDGGKSWTKVNTELPVKVI